MFFCCSLKVLSLGSLIVLSLPVDSVHYMSGEPKLRNECMIDWCLPCD